MAKRKNSKKKQNNVIKQQNEETFVSIQTDTALDTSEELQIIDISNDDSMLDVPEMETDTVVESFESVESSKVETEDGIETTDAYVLLHDKNPMQIQTHNCSVADIKAIVTQGFEKKEEHQRSNKDLLGTLIEFILIKIRKIVKTVKSLTVKRVFHTIKTQCSVTKCMNGLALGSIIILGGLALYSYLFSFPKALSNEQLVEEKSVVQDNYFVDIDVNEVSTETILWNATFRDAINKCLGKDTYIKLQQVTSSVNKKGNLANVVLTTELDVDFLTQRLCCVTDMTDNIGQKHNEYFYDNIDSLYLTKLDTDGWIKSQKVAVNVNFAIDAFENCADFYKFLLNDFGIKNNTEGKIIENYVYFDYTRPALDRDLTNISYDNLLDTNIQLVFKKISDTEMQPVSMIKQVDFESNDNVYSSKLVIMFKDMNTSELKIPVYKDYLEESYDETQNNDTTAER